MGIISKVCDEQGVLEPGEPGFWQVWGASAFHVRSGDLVMCKFNDEEFQFEVDTVRDFGGCAAKVSAPTESHLSNMQRCCSCRVASVLYAASYPRP